MIYPAPFILFTVNLANICLENWTRYFYLILLFAEAYAFVWQLDDQPCIGEVGLYPLYIDASNRLLNADHNKV